MVQRRFLGVPKRINIERKSIATAAAQTEKRYSFTLPLAWVYEDLMLRLHGTEAVGVADSTSIQTNGIQRCIRELLLKGQFKSGEKIIRSYSHRGVNDGVAGRTVSFAGVMLALENLVDFGSVIPQVDPIVTVGTNPFSALWHIPLGQVGTPRPHMTWLDARDGLDSLTLEVVVGIMEAAAAGDDTDHHVTAGTTTLALATCNLDLEADVREGCDKLPFGLRIVRSATKSLEVNDALDLDLGNGRNYRRVIVVATDNDVLSEARISELRFRVNKNQDIQFGRWPALRDEAKARYQIETLPAGCCVIDLDKRRRGKVFPTGGYANVDLQLKVPAGVTANQDKCFALVEEFVPNVHGREKASSPGARGRRGRGRRRAG